MVQVGVQHGDQCGSFHDDAHAGMSVAMNATLVALGITKEPFQIQIVTRKVGHVFADEKAWGKGVHGLGHRLPHRRARSLEASLQRKKEGPTLFAAAAVGSKRSRNLSDVLDAIFQGLLWLLDLGEAPVNGVRQTPQSLWRRPPFFTFRFRWREDRISPRASAIFRPGGCKGPPWSSLSTPRTTAQ